MSDDEDFSTRRVSADEMSKLHEMLDQANKGKEVSLDVSPELYARVSAVMPKLKVEVEGSEELQFAMAVRQVFLVGLEALEEQDGE